MFIKGILCKVRDTFCCLPLKLISRLHGTGYILTFLSTFTSAMNQNFVKFGEIFFFPKKEEELSQFSRVLSGMHWCHSKYFFVLNEIFIFPTSASTCGGLLRRTMRLSFGLERRHLFLFVLQTH